MKVRNLAKDVLEIEKDRVLANIADTRMATFDRKTAKTHAQIWGASKRQER